MFQEQASGSTSPVQTPPEVPALWEFCCFLPSKLETKAADPRKGPVCHHSQSGLGITQGPAKVRFSVMFIPQSSSDFPDLQLCYVGQCQSQGKSHLPLSPPARAVLCQGEGMGLSPQELFFGKSRWALFSLPRDHPGAYKPLLIPAFFQVLSLD